MPLPDLFAVAVPLVLFEPFVVPPSAPDELLSVPLVLFWLWLAVVAFAVALPMPFVLFWLEEFAAGITPGVPLVTFPLEEFALDEFPEEFRQTGVALLLFAPEPIVTFAATPDTFDMFDATFVRAPTNGPVEFKVLLRFGKSGNVTIRVPLFGKSGNN